MKHKIPKNIINHKKLYFRTQKNIMQIKSSDLTAPQSLKKSLRKNGHTFKQELEYFT